MNLEEARIIQIKRIILSSVILAVLVYLHTQIPYMDTDYSYVMLWGVLAIIMYSFLSERSRMYVKKREYTIKGVMGFKLDQAGYGILTIIPLGIIASSFNIEHGIGAFFTIMVAVLIYNFTWIWPRL
ncbi:MAG: hypothetical protein OQJ95_09890 [Kangiella sp.]|nr:hypothetical protein [Kangiella sp.]